jgi:serine protease Do
MIVMENQAATNSLSLSDELAAVAARLRRSTVLVRGRGHGAGSGVIWPGRSLIVTNAHVAQGPRSIVGLSDGRSLDALVTARDPYRDLAALAVDAQDLPAADVADSDRLRVGDLVLAVGNPLGMIGALATGIIHTTGATGARNGPGGQRWIQADVRLAPGNSGGPLADARGRVIGINTMVAGGLALAVPSNAVTEFLGGASEEHGRPRLGVTIEPVLVPRGKERLLGLLVLEVDPGSPAEAAGISTGDVLIGAGGRLFDGPYDLARALRNADPAGGVELDLIRGGRRVTREVRLPVRPVTSER